MAAAPGRSATQLSWELLADATLAGGAAMSALCAYRSDILDAAVLDVLSCVHPLVRSGGRQEAFRLFFDADRLVLAGRVSAADTERLRQVLPAAPLTRPEVTVDLSLLEALDPTALAVLADWAATAAAAGTLARFDRLPATIPDPWREVHLPM